MTRALTIPLALLLASGCATHRDAPGASLSIRLTGADRQGDHLALSTQGRHTVIDVRSRSGIGRAELTAIDGAWPRPLVLRLHLRGLESLSVRNGTVAVDAAMLSRPPYRQLCELFPEEERKGISLDPSHAFWAPVTIVNRAAPGTPAIPLDDGYFEVTLPDALLDAGTETLFIQWIDFYR